MLVVVVILALLSGIVGPRVLAYVDSARVDTARIQIQQFNAALKLYSLDTGSLPSNEVGLDALIHPNAGIRGWAGPYLDVDLLPSDPWGNPYEYTLFRDERRYQILSLGADGTLGGVGKGEDIRN